MFIAYKTNRNERKQVIYLKISCRNAYGVAIKETIIMFKYRKCIVNYLQIVLLIPTNSFFPILLSFLTKLLLSSVAAARYIIVTKDRLCKLYRSVTYLKYFLCFLELVNDCSSVKTVTDDVKKNINNVMTSFKSLSRKPYFLQ